MTRAKPQREQRKTFRYLAFLAPWRENNSFVVIRGLRGEIVFSYPSGNFGYVARKFAQDAEFFNNSINILAWSGRQLDLT
jgi:hypothetical protein